jgi:hypothetical protein
MQKLILLTSILLAFCLANFAGCNPKEETQPEQPARNIDYQLAIYMDTVWVYDGPRLVGKVIIDDEEAEHSKIIQSILDDNR